MKKIILPFGLLLLTGCSAPTDNQEHIIKQLDQEIADRIEKINYDIEARITDRVNTYVNPQSIHDSVTKYVRLAEADKTVDAISGATNYFSQAAKFYDTDKISFANMTNSSRQVVLTIKLNELTLLDKILLGGRNKMTKTSYSGVCIPTEKTDSLLSFNVYLLKTDTIRTPVIRIKSEGITNDPTYIPIVDGKGLFEIFYDPKKKKNIDIAMYIDC